MSNLSVFASDIVVVDRRPSLLDQIATRANLAATWVERELTRLESLANARAYETQVTQTLDAATASCGACSPARRAHAMVTALEASPASIVAMRSLDATANTLGAIPGQSATASTLGATPGRSATASTMGAVPSGSAASTLGAVPGQSATASTLGAAPSPAASPSLAQLKALIAEAEAAPASDLGRQAEEAVIELVAASVDHVQQVQNLQVGEATARVLERMEYTVAPVTVDNGLALLATQGAQTIAVQIAGTGEIAIDTAGFENRQCEAATEQLVAGLAEEGIALTKGQARFHDDPKGGGLIQTLSRIRQGRTVEAPAAKPAGAKRSRATKAQAATPKGQQTTAERMKQAMRQRDAQRI